MADVAIDKLSIEITGTSDSAAKSIDKLISVLEKLDNTASSNKGLNEFEKTLEKLDNTLKKCDFTKLNDLKNAKLSATFGNNIKSLGDALHGISNTTIGKLTKISKSLQTFSSVKDLSINRRFINSIRELPQAFAEYAAIDMPAFVQQLDMLNGALTRIVPNVQGYANAVNSLPRSLRTAAAASRTVASTNRTLSNSFDISNASLKSGVSSIGAYFAKISGLALGLIGIKNKIMDFVDKSNSYIENMNLFTASMGSGAEAALEFAEKAQNLMGIDMGEWARNQGIFQTLITGMGETSEHAEVMSQQLTQLGYDIASFYNMKVDDAMLKIQSGIAGELEPLRRIGWDLSDARMQIEVDDMGIDASTQKMTQAEKVAMRYKMIMEQVTIVHGDMARTIASPANQLRVLQAQLEITARTIGDLFIPALNAILPWVIAIVKAVRILAIEIAKFFGIDATFEVDYSTLDTSGIASAGDDAADSLDDANESAKELKNTVMGFDELNKLSAETDDGKDKNKNGAGVGLDFELPTYDFFEGLTDMMSQQTDKMAQRIVKQFKDLLPIVAGVGTGILAWKLAHGLINGVSAIKDSFKTMKGHSKGIADDMAKVGKTSLPKNAATDLNKMSISAGSLPVALGKVSPVMVAIAAVAALGAIHFTNLALNSEKFQSGVKNIYEYITNINWEQVVNSVKGFFSGAIEGVQGFLSDCWATLQSIAGEWGIEIPDFDLSGLLEPLQPVLDLRGQIGDAAFQCFDLQWSDALMAAGIAITAFIPGVNVAVPIVLGLIEAVSLGIRAMGDCVVSEDALAGVSEETAERFGTSLTSMEEAIGILDEIDFADAVVSQGDVDIISEKIADIESTILNNLDAERNEELAALDALKGLLPEEEIEEQKKKINQLFDDRVAAAQSGSERIKEIYATAAADNRTITDDEANEIRAIQAELQEELISSSGATKEEINKITAAMANNNEAAALQSSEKILQAAIEERDARVQAGWDSYDAAMRAADGLLEAGEISKEQYDKIQQAALATAQAEQDAANEAYYGTDGVVARVQAGLGDAAGKIDTNTGQIKSSWDMFCQDVGNAWSGFTDEMSPKVEQATKDVQTWWNGLPGWFNTEVTQPLTQAGNEVWTGISTSAQQAAEGAQEWWNGLPDWFETEISEPLSTAGSEVWGGIGTAATDAWTSAKGAWDSADTWFNNNVASPVAGFFSNAWNSISNGGLTSWLGVEQAWADTGEYFDGDVTKPVNDSFGGLWSDITGAASLASENIKTGWTGISEWFGTTICEPLSTHGKNVWDGISTSANSAWTGVKEWWGGLPKWFDKQVGEPLSKSASGIWEGISSTATEAWSSVCEWWNGLPAWFDNDIVKPLSKGASDLWSGITTSASKGWDGVTKAWKGACSWFDNKIIQPIGDFFKDTWGAISKGANNAWGGIVGVWNGASTWFNNMFIEPTKEFFDKFFGGVKDLGKNTWDGIVQTWNTASKWFEKTVTKPIAGFFGGVFSNIKTGARDAWSGVKTAFDKASQWFSTNVTGPVRGSFENIWTNAEDGARDAWKEIKNVFSGVGKFFGDTFSEAWGRVCKVFDGTYSYTNNLGDSILKGFKSIVNSLIRGINDVIRVPFRGINDALSTIRNVDIMGTHPFGWIPYISTPRIPLLATGGQVASGQLFIARENGIPEMVGRMGGQATVANNQQIVDGIKQGVVEAMLSVMSMNSVSDSGNNQPVQVVLQVGYDELARATLKGVKNLERRGEIAFGY